MKALKIAAAVGVGVPLLVVLLFGQQWYAERLQHTVRGDPKDAILVQNWLVLVDSVDVTVGRGGRGGKARADGYRLAVLDASNGNLLRDRIFSSGIRCWPGAPSRLWCETAKSLEAIDVPALTTAASVSDLLQKAGRGQVAPDLYLADDSDLLVVTTDGHGVRIDGTTFQVGDAEASRVKGRFPPKRGCKSGETEVGKEWLRFGDGPNWPLTRMPKSYGTVHAPPDAPTFLRKSDTPALLHVGELLFVLHDESLAAHPAQLLSRVTPEPRKLWTSPVGSSACMMAALSGPSLIIAFDDRNSRAYAFDTESGAVRWRFAFKD